MNTRNVLLGACAAAGVGIVLFAAGLRMTGTAFAKTELTGLLPTVSSAQTVEQSYTPDGPFSGVKARTFSGDVKLLRAQDGVSRVESRHGENVTETVTVDGGVLTIRHEQKNGPSFGNSHDSVTIYLAADAYDTLSVETASGDVDVPAQFAFQSASVATSSGEVEFAAQCGELTVATVSGDAKVRGVHAQRAVLSSVSGKIELKELTADGDLEIGTVSGDVELHRCDAKQLKITTTSGEVEGTLLSPKAFSVHTTSGKAEVPASVSGAGACEVQTVSGDIELRVAS